MRSEVEVLTKRQLSSHTAWVQILILLLLPVPAYETALRNVDDSSSSLSWRQHSTVLHKHDPLPSSKGGPSGEGPFPPNRKPSSPMGCGCSHLSLVSSTSQASTKSVVATRSSFLCKLYPAFGQSLHALCSLIFTSENTTTARPTHLIMCSFPILKGTTQL